MGAASVMVSAVSSLNTFRRSGLVGVAELVGAEAHEAAEGVAAERRHAAAACPRTSQRELQRSVSQVSSPGKKHAGGLAQPGP